MEYIDVYLVISLALIVCAIVEGVPCTQQQVDQCQAYVLPFNLAGKDSGVPVYTEETYTNLCTAFQQMHDCIDSLKATTECPTFDSDLQKGLRQSNEALCVAADYNKHRVCLSKPELYTEYRTCSTTWASKLQAPDKCRTYTDFFTCTQDKVNKYCGSEAAAYMRRLLELRYGPELKTFNSNCDYTQRTSYTSSGSVPQGLAGSMLLTFLVLLHGLLMAVPF